MYCLEVEPEIEEYGISYVYEVEKHELKLLVDVRPMESYVCLALYHREGKQPIVEFSLFVRGKVSHINDKSGEYLNFSNCSIVPLLLLSHYEIEDLMKNEAPKWTVELSIKPQIKIRYLD